MRTLETFDLLRRNAQEAHLTATLFTAHHHLPCSYSPHWPPPPSLRDISKKYKRNIQKMKQTAKGGFAWAFSHFRWRPLDKETRLASIK